MPKGLFIALLIAFGIGIMTRGRLGLRVGAPLETDAGESERTALFFLLGTYRLYTWLTTLAIVAWGALIVWRDLLQREPPLWLWTVAVVMAAGMILAGLRLYRRLGYDQRRWWLAIGHVSLVFPAMEATGPLRQEVLDHLRRRSGRDLPGPEA